MFSALSTTSLSGAQEQRTLEAISKALPIMARSFAVDPIVAALEIGLEHGCGFVRCSERNKPMFASISKPMYRSSEHPIPISSREHKDYSIVPSFFRSYCSFPSTNSFAKRKLWHDKVSENHDPNQQSVEVEDLRVTLPHLCDLETLSAFSAMSGDKAIKVFRTPAVRKYFCYPSTPVVQSIIIVVCIVACR